MRSLFAGILTSLVVCSQGLGQDPKQAVFLSTGDMQFLEELTRAVVDSSRILSGQELPGEIREFGPNRTGITLIKPGGRDCYPSFWIRDYAMSLESGFITPAEQRAILIFTAGRQADQSWITANGSLVPAGSIPDHIRISDGLPVYFPGTYNYVNQGGPLWKMPPYDDNFYFIHMAWSYLQETSDWGVLQEPVNGKSLIDRLEAAFEAVPCDRVTRMVRIDESFQTVDFGFRDIISLSGQLAFGSILKYQAALELSDLFGKEKNQDKTRYYREVAEALASRLPTIFSDDRGFLRASTGLSQQTDVWATAFAVYCGILDETAETRACLALRDAYAAGTIASEGQIRHVPLTDDFSPSTAWEKSGAALNTYQNGAYWGTPTGWVCYAIWKVDPARATQLAKEYIGHLKTNDFRKWSSWGAPFECIFLPSGYQQNPVYMTTVTCPLAAFRRILSDE